VAGGVQEVAGVLALQAEMKQLGEQERGDAHLGGLLDHDHLGAVLGDGAEVLVIAERPGLAGAELDPRFQEGEKGGLVSAFSLASLGGAAELLEVVADLRLLVRAPGAPA